MDEKTIRYHIQSALIPNYYQTFHCLMGDCRDDCCNGWRIEFNKKDYLTIKRATDKNEALHDMVTRGMKRLRAREHDQMYAEFSAANGGRCLFHTEERLCRLQMECGAEVLPNVCKIYPRKQAFTLAAKEYTLSPSCEGVLQQLWDLPQGVEFVEEPLPKNEWRGAIIQQGGNLKLYFTPLRELCIDILQNRTMPLADRMLYLGIVLDRLEKETWEGGGIAAWLERAAALPAADIIAAADITGNRDLYLLQNLKILSRIENRGTTWTEEVRNAIEASAQIVTNQVDGESASIRANITIKYSREAYNEALEQFEAAFAGYDYFFENLMVAAALHMAFPNVNSHDKLWESYVALCNLYSFYRFVSVLGCRGNATKERLFHMIVMASRATLHNNQRFEGFQKELFDNDSSTLAHMAILIKG